MPPYSRSVKFLSFLPILLIPCLLIPLMLLDPPRVYMFIPVYVALTIVFSVTIPLAVAALAARAYLRQGLPGVLALGCGMILFGLGSLASALGPYVDPAGGINYLVAVFNITILMASVFLAASAAMAVTGKTTTDIFHARRKILLPAAYAAAVGLVALTALAAERNALPPFFIQGQGATHIREFVLLAAIVLLTVSSTMLMMSYVSTRVAFHYWYALALFLLMVGLCGISLQTAVGSPLNWAARAYEYAGGVYLLIAICGLQREAKRAGHEASDVLWTIFSAQTGRKLAEEALREREELLQLFVRYAPAAIAMLDTQLRYTAASGRWLASYGLEGQNIIGRGHYEIFPEIPERLKDIHRRCLAGAVEWAEEDPFVRADGRTQWLRWEVRPWHTFSGAVGGLVIFSEDISERKSAETALRETQERFRLAVETANLGFFDWNTRTGKTFFSAQWKSQLGYADAEIPNRIEEFEQRLHPEERDRVMAHVRDYLARPYSNYEIEFHLRHRDGSYRTIYSRAELLPDSTGAHCRMLGTHLDITERKWLEESIDHARDEAERANQAKTEFLAVMSHEIRTPKNGILGFSQLLLNTVTDNESKEFLRLMHECGEKLLDIINDILDLSKIEAGKVELESFPFSLRDVLESTVKFLEVNAKSKGISILHGIDYEVPAHLVGDSGRLRQVLMNLIGNAVKFSERGMVIVSVSLAGQLSPDSASLRFTVKDEGVGIAADKLEQVFEPFSQVGGSAHAKYGGTGLGLTISKNLAELMGGTIRAESVEGRGSTFFFTARFGRVAETVQPATSPGATARMQRRPLKILVVEDNLVNQILANELLRERGHAVVQARDGKEALHTLRNETFDLVLMDVLMPVMDGEEATRRIRNGEAGDPGVPIVALTAHALKGDREKFLAAGMDAYLAKPIKTEELEDVLEHFAERKKAD